VRGITGDHRGPHRKCIANNIDFEERYRKHFRPCNIVRFKSTIKKLGSIAGFHERERRCALEAVMIESDGIAPCVMMIGSNRRKKSRRNVCSLWFNIGL